MSSTATRSAPLARPASPERFGAVATPGRLRHIREVAQDRVEDLGQVISAGVPAVQCAAAVSLLVAGGYAAGSLMAMAGF